MSRKGRVIIELGSDIEVEEKSSSIFVKGPKGELSFKIDPRFSIDFLSNNQSKQVRIKPLISSLKPAERSLYGLYGSLLNNAIVGVKTGFTKKLTIIGVGYKSELKAGQLVLHVGYSKPVFLDIPSGIEVKVESNVNLEVWGIDKELVGLIAARIRSVRPPEVYKGKGIRYTGEVIKLKAGKAGKK